MLRCTQECYKATADWEALPLKDGNLYYVDQVIDDGWVRGTDAVSNKTGMFPKVSCFTSVCVATCHVWLNLLCTCCIAATICSNGLWDDSSSIESQDLMWAPRELSGAKL